VKKNEVGEVLKTVLRKKLLEDLLVEVEKKGNSFLEEWLIAEEKNSQLLE